MLRRVSRPFFFHKKGVEFAAGLGLASRRKAPADLLSASATAKAWIATVDADEVRSVLRGCGTICRRAPAADQATLLRPVERRRTRQTPQEPTDRERLGADGVPQNRKRSVRSPAVRRTSAQGASADSRSGARNPPRRHSWNWRRSCAPSNSPEERRRLSRAVRRADRAVPRAVRRRRLAADPLLLRGAVG